MSLAGTVPSRLDMLDLMRGLAAQMVVINHMRAAFFVDFSETEARDPLTLAFYITTGFGHQAVIVFFVLSGFLVGGAGWRAYFAQNWQPWPFFLRRLTRLWLVLVPAMILTFMIDSLGRFLMPPIYLGEFFDLFTSGPDPSTDLAAGRSLPTLLGNLFFLQTIETPVFGTNSPLWSLSNEFWYYVLFIFGLSVASANLSVTLRVAAAAVLLTLAVYLPQHILIPGAIWLAGAIVALSIQTGHLRRFGNVALAAAIFAFFCGMLLARFGVLTDLGRIGSDIIVGAATALLMMAIVHRAQLPQMLARIALVTAEYSYTLYLIHFPIVLFVAAVVFDGRQVAFSAITLAAFVAILAAVNLTAYIFYLAFEAHTVKVQRAVVVAIGRLPSERPHG